MRRYQTYVAFHRHHDGFLRIRYPNIRSFTEHPRALVSFVSFRVVFIYVFSIKAHQIFQLIAQILLILAVKAGPDFTERHDGWIFIPLRPVFDNPEQPL